MKTIEVTFESIKNNIKKNYKIMAMVMGLCVVIGSVTGIIMARLYDPVKIVDKTQIQEHIEFQSLERDGGYYYNAFFSLKAKNDYIKAYLNYFEQVDLSIESRNEIAVIEKEVSNYQRDFKEAKEFFIANAPCLIDQVNSAIVFYTEKIKGLETLKEKSTSELNEVMSGKYTDDYKESRQKALSQDIVKIEENIDMFTGHIDMIEDATQSARIKKAEQADLILSENGKALNHIIDDFNNIMEHIAGRENYEIIYNTRLLNEYCNSAGFHNELDQEDILNEKKGQAIIYAKSIAGLDIKKERFLATLTFFILFGFIVSVIISAIYTPKKGNY